MKQINIRDLQIYENWKDFKSLLEELLNKEDDEGNVHSWHVAFYIHHGKGFILSDFLIHDNGTIQIWAILPKPEEKYHLWFYKEGDSPAIVSLKAEEAIYFDNLDNEGHSYKRGTDKCLLLIKRAPDFVVMLQIRGDGWWKLRITTEGKLEQEIQDLQFLEEKAIEREQQKGPPKTRKAVPSF